MSVYSKQRKIVKNRLTQEYRLPDSMHPVMRVVKGLGNNILEVESHDEQFYIAQIPPKYRECLWIKGGDYVIVEFLHQETRVHCEVLEILDLDQIKHIKSHNLWPEKFELKSKKLVADSLIESDDDNEEDDKQPTLFVNCNRRTLANTNKYDDNLSNSESDSSIDTGSDCE